MIQKQFLKALDRSVLVKLVLSISIFDIAQVTKNNSRDKIYFPKLIKEYNALEFCLFVML